MRLTKLLRLLALAPVAGHAWAGNMNTRTPPDPNQWLEEVDSPRAMAWVKQQNATARATLEADPHYKPFYAEALAIGDVLLSIGAAPVSFKNLSKITARLAPNSLVTLTLWRDGAQIPVALKIGRLPDIPTDPALLGGQDTWVEALGLGVADTTAQIRSSIKAADEPNGLIITQLRPVGLGARAGLKVGDLLTHRGTKQLTEPSGIASVERPTPEAPLLLRVVREGAPLYIAITGEDEP